MYFQQKRAIILDNHSSNFPYKPKWKQITVPKSFQNNLGATTGDTVIIRKDMLAKTIACIIFDEGPSKDNGSEVIRVNNEIRQKIGVKPGSSVLIERIDVIPAKRIKIEWFHPTTPKKYLEPEFKNRITKLLQEFIYSELADLPLMEKDRFIMNLPLPEHPESNTKIVYWLRSIIPKFPVVKLTPDTKLIFY